MLNFYDRQGYLSDYGFSCGYIEKHEDKGIRVVMWKEHNAYHVLCYDENVSKRVFWESFPKRLSALKLYKKTIHKGF